MAEISILHYIHPITGVIESHRSKVTCPKSQSFLCHLFIRGLLLHERNCERKILVLSVWLARDGISGDVSSFFWLSE